MLKKIVATCILSLAATTTVYASEAHNRSEPFEAHSSVYSWLLDLLKDFDFIDHREHTFLIVSPTTKPIAAPEIDPASALSGLTLLAGGLAVIRSRRNARRNNDRVCSADGTNGIPRAEGPAAK